MNFPDFQQHPGYLFVAATFVPLLSFVLILLARATRLALRPYRESPSVTPVYNLFGGDVGGKGGAYVALGAIAIAFLLSLTGFILFAREQGRVETQLEEARKLHGEEKEQEVERIEKEWHDKRAVAWAGHFDWLRVQPWRLSDPERGTALRLGFAIDSLNALMFVMVTFIASFIHLFSLRYMGDELQEVVEDHAVHTEEGHLHRRGRYGLFFMYLSLFCFSMLNLILADNLFQVFISWELVGVCSYLLVGFYFERQSASNAANKAFITNRVGDAGFIVGLLILWTFVGSFNFEDIFRQVRAPARDAQGVLTQAGQFVRGNADPESAQPGRQSLVINPSGSELVLFPREQGEDFHAAGAGRDDRAEVYEAPRPNQMGSMPYWLLVIAGLGIFLGCVGKSAQVPLQVWLPDAMEGPTPVSALIHAATMVAAGVYLVGRTYPLFTPEVLVVIAYVGGITLFVAATVAVVMTDIKKVLAYSTVSQLGYMMLALGVGGWVAGEFHLLTHAFFKALLFLGSGSVIYGCHHEQDMLRMGGLYPKMKVTALTMLMGVLAIAGIPLFTGWYSKDAIMAQALGYVYVHPQHLLLLLLPLATVGLTAFYMFRMWLLTFTGTPRDEHVYEHAHETPWEMTTPLIVLAVCSVVAAWGWPIWDAEASFLEGHIHHAQPLSVVADFGRILEAESAELQARSENHNAHRLHFLAGNLALAIGAIGIVFAFLLYYYRVLDPAEAKEQFPRVHAFLTEKWYFDRLYSAVFVRPALVVATWFRAFDLGVIDGFINALGRGTVRVAKWDGRFDNGVIDGLVNLLADVTWWVGARLRNVQTGYLRSYVLFLVLAAVCIFAVLSYFVRMAVAG
jgi:NADH-quinone oxidoreductase subunit L